MSLFFPRRPDPFDRMTIKDNIESHLKEYCFSGYQLYAERLEEKLSLFGGKTSYWPLGRSVDEGTFFDLGSLTKVFVTTSVLSRAVDREELKLDQKLGHFSQKLEGSAFGSLTLQDLLAHSTGLKGWAPLYQELGKRDVEEWYLEKGTSLFVEKTGAKAIYSDLGFILLGLVLKKVWGGIADAFEKEVRGPLKLQEMQFLPLPKTAEVVATEYCLARDRLLHGEVFDENTWALGGISSHAGLFGTARSAAVFCKEWLLATQGKSNWLSQKTAKLFTSPSNRAPGSTWALGWDRKSKAFSTAGDKLSLESFGHLGYPGVSVWCDPKAEGFVIFFTNRIHPSRVDERIKKFRPRVHDLVAESWGIGA
jgi:serine-type D-Ala-D-Ala carboxypeptidase